MDCEKRPVAVKKWAYITEQLPVYSREVGYEGQQRLQYPQLDVDSLVHAVAHGRDDERDSGLGDCLQGNKALEGPQGYHDDLRVLGCAAHENGPQEIVRLGPIYTVMRLVARAKLVGAHLALDWQWPVLEKI